MRSILLLFILIGLFAACEKPEEPADPNRPQEMVIGEDPPVQISELIFQKSSFSNQGTLFILGEGLNYIMDQFSIQGTGDYIQLNIFVDAGNDIDGGIYRFNQFFGDPFTINFGQLAEDYNWGSCFCTNITDIIMEVHPQDLENLYELDIIGRNSQDRIFKAYYNGEIKLQLF